MQYLTPPSESKKDLFSILNFSNLSIHSYTFSLMILNDGSECKVSVPMLSHF